jgi:hypothetical protein
MSAKRPAIDLLALTSEQATPMPEAGQRMAPPVAPPAKPAAAPAMRELEGRVPTAELASLAFKVSPEFRRRFRQRAANADLKLNELLFAALAAWEEKQGVASKKS